MRPSRAEFAVLGLLLVPAHSARGQAIGQGFDLERAGQYQRAATVYFTTLRGEPTNLAALLGLERVLPSLSRLPELLPAAQRAVAASPGNAALRAVLLRTYVALNEPDSARAVAQRWTAEQPRAEAPYREWAIALEDVHRFDEARQVFLFGRRALGRPGVFGIELGELLERVGEWEEAAREWAAALSEAPAQLLSAASSLAEAPVEQRERIVRAILAPEPKPLERRLAGELLLGWGQPERAWSVFAPAVAEVAADSTAPPDAQALAQSALVEALIDDGQLSEAATRLGAESRLFEDDRAALRLKLARARIQRGELDLADSVLLADSSVDALALRGWVALYSGDMKEAQEMFRAAGPYAGDRRDATERSGVLALLQQLPGDRFPELGSALLLLARGDSARAVQSLRLAAARLETRGSGGEGRADILLLAGRVAVRLDALQQQTALTLFAEVAGTPGKSAAAPAAELGWARLLLRQLKTAEAIAHLEHLILAYPESAVVPEARRELERAKGAIPKS